jgi:Protein of unknown function (DUF2905)
MIWIAKILVILGVVFIITGGVLYLFSRPGITIGQLPGDIRWESSNFTCVIALGTSILLSILLTLALNIIVRIVNK